MSKLKLLGTLIVAFVTISTILIVGFVRGDFTFIYSDGSEFYNNLIEAYEKSEDISLRDKSINTFEFDNIAVIVFVDDEILNVVPIDINKDGKYRNSGYQYSYLSAEVKRYIEYNYSYENETLYFGVCSSNFVNAEEYSYYKLELDVKDFNDIYFVYRIDNGE